MRVCVRVVVVGGGGTPQNVGVIDEVLGGESAKMLFWGKEKVVYEDQLWDGKIKTKNTYNCWGIQQCYRYLHVRID